MKCFRISSITLTFVMILSCYVLSEIPRIMTYQGRLTNSEGAPVVGFENMVFTLYNDSIDGTPLWTETQFDIPLDSNGLFNVIIGDTNSIPDSVFNISNIWLSVKITHEQDEISPRTKLASVAYSFNSLKSDTSGFAEVIADNSVTSSKIQDGTINFSDIGQNGATENQVMKWNGSEWDAQNDSIGTGSNWNVQNSVLYTNNPLGISRGGANNIIYGDSSYTMIGIGMDCNLGLSGQSIEHISILGGKGHTATSKFSTIIGGLSNTTSGDYSTIVGGENNFAQGRYSICGGRLSNASAYYSVSFGYLNSSSNWGSTVSGGQENTASGWISTVSGGEGNLASGQKATVGGGYQNYALSDDNTIAGGFQNVIDRDNSTIGGGTGNHITASGSTIGGGNTNRITGGNSIIGGGVNNYVGGSNSAILGGYADTISSSANYSYLFGINSNLSQDSTFMIDMPHIRFGNESDGYEFPESDGISGQVISTDGSGHLNWSDVSELSLWSVSDSILHTNGNWAIVRGSADNIIGGTSAYTVVNLGTACTTGVDPYDYGYQTVSGGLNNRAGGMYTVVGGGQNNYINIFANHSTIAGGRDNIAGNYNTTVGGGANNSATGKVATVCGGFYNTAEQLWSVVCGGKENHADWTSFIGGGEFNSSLGSHSVIAGGDSNYVGGAFSAIVGGYADTIENTAHYSYLFGINSNLTEDSTFMVDMPHIRFGDESTGYEFPESDGTNGQVMATDGDGQLDWINSSVTPTYRRLAVNLTYDSTQSSTYVKVGEVSILPDSVNNYVNVIVRVKSSIPYQGNSPRIAWLDFRIGEDGTESSIDETIITEYHMTSSPTGYMDEYKTFQTYYEPSPSEISNGFDVEIFMKVDYGTVAPTASLEKLEVFGL